MPGSIAGLAVTLGDYLAQQRYPRIFIDNYLVPMGAAIWSTDPARMLDFPARFFVRKLSSHDRAAKKSPLRRETGAGVVCTVRN